MKTAKELTTIAMNAAFANAEQDKKDMRNFVESLSNAFEATASAGEFTYFIRLCELPPQMKTMNPIALLREQLEELGFEVKNLGDRIKVSWMKV
jgi:hypothetical protein